jgi:hypothetical protein
MAIFRSLILGLLAASLLLTGVARAQGSTPAAGEPPPLTAQELDSLLAPIALYPDALLSQVLMASTYPLEVVSAARWAKANPDVKGDAALKKVENETWDVSVKSLAAFPNILEMMNEKLDWTQKLGDAFLAQQKDVLDSVQRLRRLAKDNGNLESNQQQVVRSEAQAIIIEPAQPQTIYVPAYNPTVVYGAWPYPAYPPYYYPGVAMWYPGGALVRGFAWGVGFAAAGAMFGGCNWGRGDIDIDINRATNIDRSFNRNSVSSGNKWQHNAQHRGNAPYRDKASQERFGNKQAERSREQFRGREGGERGGDRDGIGGDRGDRGGRDGVGDRGGRDGAGDRGGRDGAGDRGGRDGAGDRGGRDGAGGRDKVSSGDRKNAGGDRGGNRASALDGVSSGNRDLDRGRSSTAASRPGTSGGDRSFGGSGGGRSAGAAGGGSRSFSGGGGGGGGRAGGGGSRGGRR